MLSLSKVVQDTMEGPLLEQVNQHDGPLAVMEWFTGSSRAFRFAVGTEGVLLGSAPGADIRLGIKDPPVLALFRHDGQTLFCRILAPQCPLRLNGVAVGAQSTLQVNDRLELAGQTALVVHVALGLPLSAKVGAPELVAYAKELESQATLVEQWHKSLEARESQLNHRESQWPPPMPDVFVTKEPVPFVGTESIELPSPPLAETIESQTEKTYPSNPPYVEAPFWPPSSSWEEADDSWEFLASGESPIQIDQKDPQSPDYAPTESSNPQWSSPNPELDPWNQPLKSVPHAWDQEEIPQGQTEELLSESEEPLSESLEVPPEKELTFPSTPEVSESPDQGLADTFQGYFPSVIRPDCTVPLGDYLCAGNLPETEPVEALSATSGVRVFLEAISGEAPSDGLAYEPPPWEQENLPHELATYQHNGQQYQVWEIPMGPWLLDLDLAPVLGIWYHLILQATLGVRALHEAGRCLGKTQPGWVVLDPSGLVKLRGPGVRGTDAVGDLDALGQLARSLWIKAFGANAPQPEFLKNLLGRLGSQSVEIDRMETLEQLSGELDRVGLRIRNNPYAFASLLRKTFPGWTPPASKRISA